MKTIFPLLLWISLLSAQTDSVRSGVYYWKGLNAVDHRAIDYRPILKGSAADFSLLNINAVHITPGQAMERGDTAIGMEELIIVKEGRFKVTMKNDTTVLGPGSIVLVMPGDNYRIENASTDPGAVYSMQYSSKSSPDLGREKKAGGSLIVDWNGLVFKEHERGGIRQYFERPTVMTKRFEMHVTTLKEGIKSHEPHTHRAEEIVLIIDGNVEMQIGEGFKKASAGDLIFLGANVPHALKNIGKSSCRYFAFQWE